MLTQAVSFLGFLSLQLYLQGLWVNKLTRDGLGRGEIKRDKRRQNPSKALKVNAEEGVNKAPDSDIKQVMPDSREG